VSERTKKITILKQRSTHFEAKRERGVRTPFPPNHIPERHTQHSAEEICEVAETWFALNYNLLCG